jgi:hypothetical protein
MGSLGQAVHADRVAGVLNPAGTGTYIYTPLSYERTRRLPGDVTGATIRQKPWCSLSV